MSVHAEARYSPRLQRSCHAHGLRYRCDAVSRQRAGLARGALRLVSVPRAVHLSRQRGALCAARSCWRLPHVRGHHQRAYPGEVAPVLSNAEANRTYIRGICKRTKECECSTVEFPRDSMLPLIYSIFPSTCDPIAGMMRPAFQARQLGDAGDAGHAARDGCPSHRPR